MKYSRENRHPMLADYGPQYRYEVGDKYDPALSTKEIAVRIRADIKQAIKVVALPPGKYSVKYRSFAGGTSIDVSVSDLHKDFRALTLGASGRVEPSTPGKWVMEALRRIVESYNYDRCDSMTDFFSVNFYSSVAFDWDWTDMERKVLEEIQDRETA